MSGFLYIEPYEVRKEIIARPLDLQFWIDLGLDGRENDPRRDPGRSQTQGRGVPARAPAGRGGRLR